MSLVIVFGSSAMQVAASELRQTSAIAIPKPRVQVPRPAQAAGACAAAKGFL